MTASPKILVGASIPRSGHHFLQNLLKKYFAEKLYYCETYSVGDCCKETPCTRRGDFSLIYQKSHDRDMEVPKGLSDAVYILQYRHPVPEALSDRELDVQDEMGRICLNYRLSREHYAFWLARKAVYYRRFHDKWLVERAPNGVYLDYEYLSRDPAGAVEQIARAATGAADRARIEAVVEQGRSVRVSSGKSAATFKPRVVQDSPHFDADLLGAFEDYVIAHAPSFGYERMLQGRCKDHPFEGLILALDDTVPLPAGETDRLAAAIARAGEHPELMMRLAQRELRGNKPAAAAERLTRVLERHPYFTPAWRHLFAAHRALKTAPPVSLFSGNALLGMVPRPELLVDAGKLLMDAGQVVNAAAALALATSFAPDKGKAHQLLAAAWMKLNRPERALQHAEAANRHEPSEGAGKLVATARERLARRAGPVAA